MDQTTFTHQSILRHIRECPQIANLDCDIYLRTGSHYQERTETQAKSLHNFTNFESRAFTTLGVVRAEEQRRGGAGGEWSFATLEENSNE